MTKLRIGHGYDVHRLAAGRSLILGGVTIPYDRGLDGHSDADVLTHAVMDALLGAAALGDIGRLFPDSDDAFLNISSLVLLSRVRDALADAGYRVVNIDATLIDSIFPNAVGKVIDQLFDVGGFDTASGSAADVAGSAGADLATGFDLPL